MTISKMEMRPVFIKNLVKSGRLTMGKINFREKEVNSRLSPSGYTGFYEVENSWPKMKENRVGPTLLWETVGEINLEITGNQTDKRPKKEKAASTYQKNKLQSIRKKLYKESEAKLIKKGA